MFDHLRSAWAQWREASALRRHAIPESLWQLTLLRYPFLSRRSSKDLAALRRLSSLFLASKEFHGVADFQVSDEVVVAVAAQACLPVLHLGLDWYSGFVGIVMHADEVVAQREYVDDDGIVHHYEEELAGEAMEGGPLMLSWSALSPEQDPAAIAPESVYNLVIHEFAHVIDMHDGYADGVPALPSAAARAQWLAVLEPEWQRFCSRVEAGHTTLIDPYGTVSLEEFFAVAVEAFFVAPAEMRAEQAALYRLLADFFRVDAAIFSSN